MTSNPNFWDRWAKRYAAKPIADEAAYEEKLRRTREYLAPDMNVLEVGCGTGGTSIRHAPYVRHIRATDISPKMLEIARSRATEAGVDNVTFERSDIEHLAVEAGSVDVVLTLSLLHLLEDRDKAIRRIFNMLKPGGVFVSSTICLGDSLKFIKYLGPVGRVLGLMPYLAVFSAQELATSISSAGFDIEDRWQPGDGRTLFVIARRPAE